jgi:hypothetical protein
VNVLPAAIAAAAGNAFPVPGPVERHALVVALPSVADHHGEQEDYLWGV